MERNLSFLPRPLPSPLPPPPSFSTKSTHVNCQTCTATCALGFSAVPRPSSPQRRGAPMMAWAEDEAIGPDVALAGLHVSERIGRDAAAQPDLEEALEASRYASHPYSSHPKECRIILTKLAVYGKLCGESCGI
ncbi:uncharacterized protein LOC123435617 [Hordeum vulgare subsp. vulgare]|uniref:uncharacterized protein LOC123435617 n=1 Tax=Hordeum vulgare subsp. vulgare TaxID=112509 RepID=UPI000B465B69|nr:uncharacterized protein LOC123435617 [Hordeum vulgare subsp. vulgare]XP_044971519.1 uncharacterized protein LOC123435617 [Hordeum vulgare subsp. vulgare]